MFVILEDGSYITDDYHAFWCVEKRVVNGSTLYAVGYGKCKHEAHINALQSADKAIELLTRKSENV